jgi:ribosomal protein L37AE/L43A
MREKENCPKCGRKMYERDIDWEAGECWICKGDED